MVPYLDMCNTIPECTECLAFNIDQRCGIVQADRAYAPGEQVFISYGEKSSGEMLIVYGFVPSAETPNVHETVEITLRLQEGDPLYAPKAA
eukprot:CAMPEP_0197851150 /NCGR_PEP_ID=MMETSP1438-20131217/17394_1 /TAXON_ID=1461541 /ORGANISM="Pterosperma sp., Strain CCMP1384" /LENGTH=90 /DNA_ID=CAMNT_0043464649 /DNA_START=15 /DNA_END=284 /DNA_ORIENTATION=+